MPLNVSPEAWPHPAADLVLRPDAGWHQPPWVWWTTAWLHGSTAHLWRNLAGTALLALLGWLIRPDRRTAIAWALAWPLTQVGMLWQPTLASYVGLSGVLHAGVAILGVQALLAPHRHTLGWVGALLLAGLSAKILMENPWGHALVLSPASAINVAPWAHFSGSVAGVWMVTLVRWIGSRKRSPAT